MHKTRKIFNPFSTSLPPHGDEKAEGEEQFNLSAANHRGFGFPGSMCPFHGLSFSLQPKFLQPEHPAGGSYFPTAISRKTMTKRATVSMTPRTIR